MLQNVGSSKEMAGGRLRWIRTQLGWVRCRCSPAPRSEIVAGRVASLAPAEVVQDEVRHVANWRADLIALAGELRDRAAPVTERGLVAIRNIAEQDPISPWGQLCAEGSTNGNRFIARALGPG